MRHCAEGVNGTSLQQRFADLSAEDNATLFCAADEFLQSPHEEADPWERFARLAMSDGVVHLRSDPDLSWVKAALGDTARSQPDRAMLLKVAIYLSSNGEDRREHFIELSTMVADLPSLVATIDPLLNPPEPNPEIERLEQKQAVHARA